MAALGRPFIFPAGPGARVAGPLSGVTTIQRDKGTMADFSKEQSLIAAASSVKSRRPSCSSTCRRTVEIGARGRARSLKPTADIDAGMSFSAIMPRSRHGGLLGVPLEHLELAGIASNHEPMHWIRAFRTAHLALILCHCRHGEAFLGSRPIRCCMLLDETKNS
jgi:hypothetical protein